jgi:anti-sigma regulatory factor (Ser/Thr protein kinase)
MLDTVIRNLTANALKFTPQGGHITISAILSSPPKQNKTLPMAEIWVKDTGIGISQANIAKLFRIDTHHTTQGTAQEQGTGLGLIMCQEMVIKNQGRIWVESKLNSGTTVKFTIPLHQTADVALLQTIEPPQLPDLIQPVEEDLQASAMSSFENLVAPPQEILATLLDMAERGNLRGLSEEATRLKDLDINYTPFADKLHLLANNFEDREIMDLIKEYYQTE